MVLCGAVGTVVAFLIISRLRPGQEPRLIQAHITDDQFALLIEETDAAFDVPRMSDLLARHHAAPIEERVLDQGHQPDTQMADARTTWSATNIALTLVLGLCALAVLVVPRNRWQPTLEYFPTMRRAVPMEPQTAYAGLQVGQPLPGTLARDAGQPLHYEPTDVDARRAGEELVNPFSSDDAKALERGQFVFTNFCASCHGPAGEGDGLMVLRGYPPPPTWNSDKSRQLRDGELFHVISYGRNNMPPHRLQLSQEDRWRVVLHIRALQQRAVTQAAAATPAEPAPDILPPENSSPDSGAAPL
jgi:mono/diheme cytochrome c family protein